MPDAELSDLLDGQLAFLLDQQGGSALLAVHGFLQSLRREPRLAIHLDDLSAEADTLGRELRQEEYNGGNPGQLLELCWDEIGQKAPPGPALDAFGRKASRFKSLLGDFDHPFMLPIPSTNKEPLGRVTTLVEMVNELVEAVRPTPILEVEATGFQNMFRRNAEIQKAARVTAGGEPSVALLRLEAVENVMLEGTSHADSRPPDGSPALRVELTSDATDAVASFRDDSDTTSSLAGIVEDVHRSARLLILDLRRRLHTTRSRLGVVQRFKARCEWHDRERLRQLADDVGAAGGKPEHALRDELTRYLFDQGLNPFAEAVLGTSSRADVFDPSRGPSFYVEAKQYGDRAGLESELRAAFRQALDTVGNVPGSGYTLDEAFIVLFRRAGPRAILPAEPFSADGLRWYFVLINIADASEDASQNTATPEEYTAEELRAMLLEVREQRTREINQGDASAA